MEIGPQTVSGSCSSDGSLQPGCRTSTGSFYLWAWIWRGRGTQSGFLGLVHGVSSGGPGEDLCTYCHFRGFCSVGVDCTAESLWGSLTCEAGARTTGSWIGVARSCGSGSVSGGCPGRRRNGRNCEGSGALWTSSG